MKSNLFLSLALFLITNLSAQTTPIRVYPSSNAQVETPIAINPTNPNNLICAAILQDASGSRIGCYYSTTSGQSWIAHEQGFTTYGMGDPFISFNTDGVAFLLYQCFNEAKFYLRKSYDGGETWTSANVILDLDEAIEKLDRPWMAISPKRNQATGYFNIYVSYTHSEIVLGSDPIMTVHVLESTDEGNNFNDIFESFSVEGFSAHGSTISIGLEGEIAVAWANINTSNYYAVENVAICASMDNFLQHIYPTTQIGTLVKSESSNLYYIKDKKLRVDCFPRMATNPLTGDFYVTWASASNLSDILFVKGTKQTNGSITWPTQTTNIESASGDQFMPAISVAPNGVISVFYFTSGNDDISTPIYGKLKYSSNNGSSFTAKPVFGGFSFSATDNFFVGDYHGLASWIG